MNKYNPFTYRDLDVLHLHIENKAVYTKHKQNLKNIKSKFQFNEISKSFHKTKQKLHFFKECSRKIAEKNFHDNQEKENALLKKKIDATHERKYVKFNF